MTIKLQKIENKIFSIKHRFKFIIFENDAYIVYFNIE